MSIKLQGIAKSFAQGESTLKILDGLDLELKSGEVVAVIGESGSGKSTLLSLIGGFERPETGDVVWNSSSTAA